MFSITEAGAAVKPPSPLAAALARDGWQPGPPPRVSWFSQAIDAGLAAEMECGRCGNQGMDPEAFHRGTTYRLVCSCPVCAFTEDF